MLRGLTPVSRTTDGVNSHGTRAPSMLSSASGCCFSNRCANRLDMEDPFSSFLTRASTMISFTERFGWPSLFAGLTLSWCSLALAQEKTPFPALSDKRVYVAGVPDRYQALETQINQLERSSPQTYYVVVVKRTGRGEKATTGTPKSCSGNGDQAPRSRRSFEADRPS